MRSNEEKVTVKWRRFRKLGMFCIGLSGKFFWLWPSKIIQGETNTFRGWLIPTSRELNTQLTAMYSKRYSHLPLIRSEKGSGILRKKSIGNAKQFGDACLTNAKDTSKKCWRASKRSKRRGRRREKDGIDQIVKNCMIKDFHAQVLSVLLVFRLSAAQLLALAGPTLFF